MDLPELPPGSALDPGWVDRGSGRSAINRRTRRNPAAARHAPDEDDILTEAMGLALRDERIAIWKKLWDEAKSKDERIAALRAEVRAKDALIHQLRAQLGLVTKGRGRRSA